MKTESFTKLLRKIIREEVTLAVRKEFKTLLTEKKTDHKKVINHGVQLSNIAKGQPKKYVKDPMLNDLLNETANTAAPITNDWPTMDYRSNMAQSFKSMMSNESEVPHVAPMTDIHGKSVNVADKKVANVVNAMTKDYSALMKAIDKKKGK